MYFGNFLKFLSISDFGVGGTGTIRRGGVKLVALANSINYLRDKKTIYNKFGTSCNYLKDDDKVEYSSRVLPSLPTTIIPKQDRCSNWSLLQAKLSDGRFSLRSDSQRKYWTTGMQMWVPSTMPQRK